MMTREEALEEVKIFTDTSRNAISKEIVESIINDIYKSIGTCNGCSKSEDILKDIVEEAKVIVDSENSSPDIYVCPFCESMIVQGKKASLERSSEKELMVAIPHHEPCIYTKAVKFFEETK